MNTKSATTLSTGPTTTSCNLPLDVIECILVHLAITPGLMSVALASKHILAPTILCNIFFARHHFRHHHQASGLPFWEFLDFAGIKGKVFEALPFSYKQTIYQRLMVEKHWEGCELLKVEQKEHERHCLGHMTHWQLSESLTLRIILMLSNDPNIDLMGTGAKPLHWAIANNHTIIVKTLLHLYPNVDLSRDSNRLLAKAAASGHSEVVKLILSDPRVDPAIGDTRFMPLALAAHFGKVNSDREDSYVKVVKILLADSRVDPTFPDNMAVQCAARGSSIEKMLLADARVRLLGVPRGNGLFEKLGGWVFSTITQFLP